jgi:hypothetical protein
MKSFFEGVFDVVFSIPTFIIALIFGFALLIIGITGAEELRTKQTAYCYSLGQVLVKTDAGIHCVAPQNLTAIK